MISSSPVSYTHLADMIYGGNLDAKTGLDLLMTAKYFERIGAVSYTHLDVYKRQEKEPVMAASSILSISSIVFLIFLRSHNTAAIAARKPVSYTHLDVYKRQFRILSV